MFLGITDFYFSENFVLLFLVFRLFLIFRVRSIFDLVLYIYFSVVKFVFVLVVVCLGGFLGSFVFISRFGSYIMFLFDDRLVLLIFIIIVVF